MNWKKLLVTIGVVVLCLSCALLLPCIDTRQQVREGSARFVSQNNLKQIGLALWAYHDLHKGLPPAMIKDKNGKPLYSWRVAILPFVEQLPLYKQFKLDEPWDSPHNKALLPKMPPIYANPMGDDPPHTTRYQAFVGPGTAFERPGLTLMADFPDGTSNTLLVVEAGQAVPWSKPADLNYDPAGPLPPLGGVFTSPVKFLCYEVDRLPGFNACFADGSVRWMDGAIEPSSLRALITRNGGEEVPQ